MNARQIMESLQEMFRQLSSQIQHEALKYVYNAGVKEGQSVREHVIDLMVQFNVTEMSYRLIMITNFHSSKPLMYIVES